MDEKSNKENSATQRRSIEPNLPNGFHLQPFGSEHIAPMQSLLDAAFPVRYSPSFYADCVNKYQATTRVVYKGSLPIGLIACRVEAHLLYIMVLAILPLYRSQGLGAECLRFMLRIARENHGCSGAYLHVWTQNVDAVAFYEREGFVNVGKVKGYYRRVDPPDSYLLKLQF